MIMVMSEISGNEPSFTALLSIASNFVYTLFK